MRGSGVRILFAAPSFTRNFKHIRAADVQARWSHCRHFCTQHNAWVGTANPLCGTIKISSGKHIRDASVLARGLAVPTFAPEQCVGQRFESSLRAIHEGGPPAEQIVLVFLRLRESQGQRLGGHDQLLGRSLRGMEC
jgi:hypothetical protein